MAETTLTVSLAEDQRDTRESLVALVNGTRARRGPSAYPTGEAALVGVLAEGLLGIACQLGIGIRAVRTHVRHINEKLQVQTRTAAAGKYFGRSG